MFIKEVDNAGQSVQSDQEGEGFEFEMAKTKASKLTVLSDQFPEEAYAAINWLKRS
jgi:hypothetical protein